MGSRIESTIQRGIAELQSHAFGRRWRIHKGCRDWGSPRTWLSLKVLLVQAVQVSLKEVGHVSTAIWL